MAALKSNRIKGTIISVKNWMSRIKNEQKSPVKDEKNHPFLMMQLLKCYHAFKFIVLFNL